MKKLAIITVAIFLLTQCSSKKEDTSNEPESPPTAMELKLNDYKSVRLTADLSVLSEKEKQMIPIPIGTSEVFLVFFSKQFWSNIA